MIAMATEEFYKLKTEIESILLDLAALDTTPTHFLGTRRALITKLNHAVKRLEQYTQQREQPETNSK